MSKLDIAREAYLSDDLRKALRYTLLSRSNIITTYRTTLELGYKCLKHRVYYQEIYGDLQPIITEAIIALEKVLCVSRDDTVVYNYD